MGRQRSFHYSETRFVHTLLCLLPRYSLPATVRCCFARALTLVRSLMHTVRSHMRTVRAFAELTVLRSQHV